MSNLDNAIGTLPHHVMLSDPCNMGISSNKLLQDALEVFRGRLPEGWKAESLQSTRSLDAMLEVVSAEGVSGKVRVELEKRIDPRIAKALPVEGPVVVVAPYLSRAVREVLEERGASYVDRTGNIRFVLDSPGLFVLTSGAEANPSPDARQLTLRGVKAGRVVRALAACVHPLGVRELAELADTDPGYVSRLLAMLDREALVDRTSRGGVERVAWRKLLVRWSEDAPLSSRAASTTWLAPRGLTDALNRLGDAREDYSITGSVAAARVAPVAPANLLSIYAREPDSLAERLDLRPAAAGSNVLLLQPEDDAIYAAATVVDALRYASLPLVAADLLTGPGRSPAEAEALMDWMDENTEAWRG